jgi:hypothetical protein
MRLDIAAYRALSPRQRQIHDLHRAATHANLPLQETPESGRPDLRGGSQLSSPALGNRYLDR